MGTEKKMCAAYDDLDHFAPIPFHYVACLYVSGQFLESFIVAEYNPLVRFALACRSDVQHSVTYVTLTLVGIYIDVGIRLI